MTRFAIDPLTLVLLAEDPLNVHTSHQLVAPNTIRTEALQLLLQRVCSGSLTERSALALHERMTGVKLRLLGDRVSRRTAWQIARERDWSVLSHAEYLAVAQLQADALIASDVELAAHAAGVVPLGSLADLLTA